MLQKHGHLSPLIAHSEWPHHLVATYCIYSSVRARNGNTTSIFSMRFKPLYKASVAPYRIRNLPCARQEWVDKRPHEKVCLRTPRLILIPRPNRTGIIIFSAQPMPMSVSLQHLAWPFLPIKNVDQACIGASVCLENNDGGTNSNCANQFDFVLLHQIKLPRAFRIEPRPRARSPLFSPLFHVPPCLVLARPTPPELQSKGPPERSSTFPARIKSNTGDPNLRNKSNGPYRMGVDSSCVSRKRRRTNMAHFGTPPDSCVFCS